MPAPNRVPAFVFEPRDSRRSRRSPISISPPNLQWTMPTSPASKPVAGFPKHATSSSSDPGTGKTHLATALAVAAAHTGYRVGFASATAWITRLAEAHRLGRLDAELKKISRIGLIVIDEVGYIPFDAEATNLFFQLVSSR